MKKYRCKYCGKTVLRQSKKAWIKSYCALSGKTVRLIFTIDDRFRKERENLLARMGEE